MQSTLNPKQSDDPHDVLVVAPDVVLVAPTDEELSRLAHTMRHPSNPQPRTESEKPQIRAGSDLPAGPTVPPVDTTFRPAVSDVQMPDRRRSIGGSAARAFIVPLLLAACTGAVAISWQSYGDAAKLMIAQWAPQRLLTSLLPQDKPALPAQPAPPAVEATTADAAPSQVAPPQPTLVAQTAAEGVAPGTAAPSAGSVRSTAQDIASMGQEIEQLKASIEELKAGQQQMSREIAKASEQNLRPRISALAPRSTAARVRKPMPPLPPAQAAAAPMLPPAAAPYVPRQPEPLPQATTEPLSDPELASVPRPPMPVR
jgi:hypothetical protein